MTAKTVESLWFRGTKFSFSFADEEGPVILGDFLFLPFACLHIFEKLYITFDTFFIFFFFLPPKFVELFFFFISS